MAMQGELGTPSHRRGCTGGGVTRLPGGTIFNQQTSAFHRSNTFACGRTVPNWDVEHQSGAWERKVGVVGQRC